MGLPKCSAGLNHGPCPPARDWGSRVSGLVLTSFVFLFITLCLCLSFCLSVCLSVTSYSFSLSLLNLFLSFSLIFHFSCSQWFCYFLLQQFHALLFFFFIFIFVPF